MAKKYKKTAKDKAWDQERTKLIAQLYKQKKEYSALLTNYQEIKCENIQMKDENVRLRELLSTLTERKPEDILKDIDASKKTADHIINLLTLGGFFH